MTSIIDVRDNLLHMSRYAIDARGHANETARAYWLRRLDATQEKPATMPAPKPADMRVRVLERITAKHTDATRTPESSKWWMGELPPKSPGAAQLRRWAKSIELTVPSRGAIPAEVYTAYGEWFAGFMAAR
jgi:hypothetical protein